MDQKKDDAVWTRGLTTDETTQVSVDEIIRLFGSKPLKAEWFANQTKKKNQENKKGDKK